MAKTRALLVASGAPEATEQAAGVDLPIWLAAPAFCALLGLLTWILSASLGSATYAPTSDDGYYLHYMVTVARDGPLAFPELFRSWNATPGDWVFPPPTRLAYISASALLSKLLGPSLVTLSWVSLLSHLGWVTVNWAFARRQRGDAFALALAALCGFSPLLMGLGRLALMDDFACFCVTLALWLFLEALQRPESLVRRVLFGVAFALALLTKELSVFIAPPLALMVLLERFLLARRLSLPGFAATLALPGLVALPIMVLAAGGFEPLLTTTTHVLTSPKTNPHALMFCQGPWYRYLIDFLCLSPFPTLLGILAAGALIERVRAGAWPRSEVFFLVVGVGLLVQQAFFIKNARYMVALELPLRYLALSSLVLLAGGFTPRSKVAALAALVLTLCLLDWHSFQTMWVDGRGYDPMTFILLQQRGIIQP